jgi:hypothetical protein
VKYVDKLGSFTVGYKATIAGHYQMHIRFEDMTLGTFPLAVSSESGSVPGAAPSQTSVTSSPPPTTNAAPAVKQPEPKQEAKPVQPVETKKEEQVPVKEEPKPEPVKEEPPVPKLPLATSPESASPTDGLSRENSMAGLTKEQKLAIIRERKAKLLTPRSAAEAEKTETATTSTSSTSTSEPVAAKIESESSDDIASAVITEIRVTFKALNKHGKPKSAGGDAKKLEIAPHHEVVDNHDGSYTVTLGKPEHFAVKIDGHPVLRAEFI